jgi:hypothetical protein
MNRDNVDQSKSSGTAEAEDLCIKGGMAIQSGNFPLAIELLKKCLLIDPNNANGLNNLGAALDGTRQIERAIYFYSRAINVNPNLAVAHINLGRIHFKTGNFDQAEASYSRARELEPGSTALLKEIAQMLRAKRDFASAAEVYLRVIGASPASFDGLEAAVIMAIIYYLDGDCAAALNMIRGAAPVADLPGPHYLGVRRYATYISRLLGTNQTSNSHAFPAIHVIGDSHAISAHGVDVTVKGKKFTCESAWIEGCNQWGVGSESLNQNKRAFDICLRMTAKSSVVLVLLGQIDCLAEGGIFRQWQMSPASDIEQFASDTIRKYMSVISKYHEEGWHGIIVGGVPAPGAQYPVPEGSHGKVFLDMVRSFNTRLKQSACDAGLPFLDLYAMTETPAGISNDLWNIDYLHLRPDAYVEAFAKHLI